MMGSSAVDEGHAQYSLHVANVIEDSRLAGPQKRIALVAEALRERAVRTTVLHPEEDHQSFTELLQASGVTGEPLPLARPGRSVSSAFWYIVSYLPQVLRLSRKLKKGNFDLVHASGGAWQTKAVLAARLAGLPVVWHLNDSDMPWYVHLAFRLLHRLAEGFLISCERTRKVYFPNKEPESIPVQLAHPPVDTEQFDPEQVAPFDTVRDGAQVVVVAVGNVNPIKDYETFIRMAAKCSAERNGMRFVIVGPRYDSQKEYVAKLESQARRHGLKNLVFWGREAAVERVLAAADIFVCCSRHETGPMSLMEGMSMGLASVSTDVGDVNGFIADDIGFVVPVGDSQALSERVLELAADPDRATAMGRSARAAAIREFGVPVAVDAHLKAYRAAVTSAGQ